MVTQVGLDDERNTPEGWKRVYWPDKAIAPLETSELAEISLDHVLANDARGIGYDMIAWIIDRRSMLAQRSADTDRTASFPSFRKTDA